VHAPRNLNEASLAHARWKPTRSSLFTRHPVPFTGFARKRVSLITPALVGARSDARDAVE
jgi:hypothetical protein